MANITLCSFILLLCSLIVFADENLVIQRVLEELSELRSRVDEQDLELHQLKQVVKSQSAEIQLLKGERLADDVSDHPEFGINSANEIISSTKSKKSLGDTFRSATPTKRILQKNRRITPYSAAMHRIGLTAYRVSTDPVHPKETLIFNQVLANIGNRYNHYTGVFSADQDGLYVFYFGLECNDATIEAEIVNDDVAFGYTYCDGRSGFSNSAEMILKEVSTGSSVFVRIVSTSNQNNNVVGDKTIFSGFLLN
ncbi:uncharacterized protein LOC134247317 [Saccostrea cucullata]|uniref:uncharacterized protein LOC134247317 n=1 Tax=Saccostrea cuccullata TaxID=36930 RepID=UPI002ED1BA2F